MKRTTKRTRLSGRQATSKKKTKKLKKTKAVKSKKVKRVKAAKSKKVKKVKTAKPLAKVIHYYDRIGVAIVAVNKALSVGETVTFQKGVEEFTQCIGSMQMEHESISKAKKGAEVGIKVDSPVKEGALVLPAA
ncbi:hypothetical protein HYZ98_02300 [Candidatus Peregrinibacteria bacterium]|nr:hypothetical protein [Candidatus Peregrinibacteria bacterium]